MAERPRDDENGYEADGLDHSLAVASASGRSRRPGVLELLTESFGPVPRVVLRDAEVASVIVHPALDEILARPEGAGRYQLFGEIARGGMGAVLKGRDPDLGRALAVKVLLEKHCDDPEMVCRFVEEAQIAGQLQHPGVVPIYELGVFGDGRPYFAMKLVQGQTLAFLLIDRPSPRHDFPRFLAIFETVAQTVAYTHARGVIHRDLKPSNVMVGNFGEVQVMDWGLAKVLSRAGADDVTIAGRAANESIIATTRSASDSDLSRAGSVMGTPSYMAPEQARGEVNALDERSDVFALGSILAEIMTGSPAFTGKSSTEIQRRAARGDLSEAFARLEASGFDTELIALVKACLSPTRDDRPRDAGEIARAVGSYRTGVDDRLRAAEIARAAEAVHAEEAERTAEAAQARANAERRARRAIAALAASILVLVVLGGGAAFQVARQRQFLASRLAQRLADAETLRTRALAHSDDPALWQALAESVKQAEDVLGDGGGGPEARGRLIALRSEADAGHRMAGQDRTLLQKLVEIRADRQDAGAVATHAAYDNAFREAGFDFNTLVPADAARALERRPVSVRAEIATYLDDWYRVGIQPDEWHENPVDERMPRVDDASVERSGAAKLRELARKIDPDEFRDRLRSLPDQGPTKDLLGKLRELAADPRAESLPAPTSVLLASFFEAAGENGAAAAILRKAVARHPEDLWANYRLAANLQFATPPRLEEAARYYTAARAIRPATAHTLAHLLMNELGPMAEAKALFLDLAARQPEVPSHLSCLALALKRRGRMREAVSIADRLIPTLQASVRTSPSAFANFTLAGMQEIKGDIAGAIASLREVDKMAPNNRHRTHAMAGDMLRTTAGDSTAAIAEYRESIRLKPDYAWGHLQLGRALAVLERYKEAIAEFREADRLRPGFWEIQVSLGGALMAYDRMDDAMTAYREAMHLEPARAYIHVQLGRDLAKCGKLDEAITAFRETARIYPKDTNCHNELAQLLLNSKRDFNGAAAEFREVMRIDPDEPDAYSNVGLALFRGGKTVEGLAICREAARLRPDWGSVRFKYAVVLYDLGQDYDTALVEFQAAARLRPAAETYTTLGRFLAKLDKDREAITALQNALAFVPKSSTQADELTGWIAELERRIGSKAGITQ